MAESSNGYNWKFCTIGGVTRVKITSGDDIAHLGELDQKLWTVLSCPVKGLEFDERTLALMDTNADGKIRVNEVKAAAQWLTAVLKTPEGLLKQEDVVDLDALNQATPEGLKVYQSAKQILKNLGLEKNQISLAEASDSVAIFAKTALNGDGIITVQSTEDADLKATIEAILATEGGGLDDRSGLKGADAALIEQFYTDCADYKAWKAAGTDEIFVFGDDTAAALDACNALKEKVADYFMRCKLAAFNSESASVLDITAARIGELASLDLAQCNEQISAYPLARVTGKQTLTLDCALINPAWQDAFSKVLKLAINKMFPGASAITEAQWGEILAKFGPYTAWMEAKKGAAVESLGLEKVEAFLKADRKAELLKIVEDDKALEAESAGIDEVEKFIRYYRNFYKLLKNFVTLSDFYARDPANKSVFEAGTLFIDQRSTELCIRVADMGKQGDVNDLSGMCILYCDCTCKSKPEKMTIAAVITQGEVDDLRVGKNAIFYDRQGLDWDAVVVKILDNPISLRQAFWAPYKKVRRAISDRINKSVSDKNAKVEADLTEKANTVDLTKPKEAPKEGEAAAAAKPAMGGFDIAKFAGIFAAVGMAAGLIGQALVGLAEGIMAHWYNLPLLILGIILFISGPSMFLTWLKLKRRNLTPLLNANGWAINSSILINSAFGPTFTEYAKYPRVTMSDPYADKGISKGWIAAFVLLVLVAGGLIFMHCTNRMHLLTDWMMPTVTEPAPAADAPAEAPAEAK